MDDNLHDFLNERVLATREVAHVQYPANSEVPATGVMIECAEDAMTLVILPTFVKDVMHFEMHFFMDGERVHPELTRPPLIHAWDPEPLRENGPWEFTVRRTPV